MITIRQASVEDIPVIEDILLDVVNWLDSTGNSLWTKEQVTWKGLSRYYSAEDFYLAYLDGEAVGCMVLVDYDPAFWPDIQKGESLFIHKLAVKRSGAGKDVSNSLINFAKEECKNRNIKYLRLECHQFRDKVRRFYESEGFVCVDERCLLGKYHTAFYVCKVEDKHLYLLAQFNEETQRILSGYYDILRQNGFLGSQTQNIPYHFTLGIKDVGCEEQLINDLDIICANTASIDIHLSHIGLFGLNVLFIAPDMNFELLTLEQKFFPHCGSGAYNWTAHATLLIDEPEKILKALPIVAKNFKPFIARIDSIGLYEFFPTRFIKEYPLRKGY